MRTCLHWLPSACYSPLCNTFREKVYLANLAFVNLDSNPSTSPEAGKPVFLWYKDVRVCVRVCVCVCKNILVIIVHNQLTNKAAFIKVISTYLPLVSTTVATELLLPHFIRSR